MPIYRPVGVHGLAPSLGIDYRSAAGDGAMGRGWTLATGVRAIRRCAQTYAADDRRGPPSSGTSSPLCLSDKRMVLVSGQYGNAGSEYRTEEDPFEKILLFSNGGRRYFVVYRSDTYIEYFNGDFAARAIDWGGTEVQWLTDRVEDRFGNTIRYIYNTTFDGTQTTSIELEAILWSDFEARINYRPRERPKYRWVFGLQEHNTRLIDSITVGDTANPVHRYELAYDESGDGAPTLKSITLCAEGGVCVPPIKLEYEPTTYGFTAEFVAATGLAPSDKHPYNGPWTLDWNHDGFDDVIGMNLNGKWRVYEGGPSGIANIGEQLGAGTLPKAFPADIDGDGFLDLVNLDSTGKPWKALHGGRVGAEADIIIGGATPVTGTGTAEFPERLLTSLDFDGNGRPDIVFCDAVDFPAVAMGDTNSGVPLTVSLWGWPTIWFPSCNDILGAGDIDGDGDDEIIYQPTILNGAMPYLGAMSYDGSPYGLGTFSVVQTPLNIPLDAGADIGIRLVDVTGDGLPEIIGGYADSGAVYMWLNQGGGRFAGRQHLPKVFSDGFLFADVSGRATPLTAREIVLTSSVLDYNKDGLLDLVFQENLSGDPRTDDILSVLVAPNQRYQTGSPSNPALLTAHSFTFPGGGSVNPYAYRFADFNGDGNVDILAVSNGSVLVSWGVPGSIGAGLLTKVFEDDQETPKWEIVYERPGASAGDMSCDYPISCRPPIHATVASYSSDLGPTVAGQTWRTHTLSYRGSAYDALGQGWLGFTSLEVESSVGTQVESMSTTTYGRQREPFSALSINGVAHRYPYVGVHTFVRETIALDSSEISTTTTIAWQLTQPQTNSYSIARKSMTYSRSEGGIEVRRGSRNWGVPDQYGNIGIVETITPETYSGTATEYAISVSDWLVHRPSASTSRWTEIATAETATTSVEYRYTGPSPLPHRATVHEADSLLEATYSYTVQGNLEEVVVKDLSGRSPDCAFHGM